MDRIRCTEDNRIYTAIEFSELNFVDLERKRRLLACLECGGPAFFSTFSSNGRTAYFGARPHAYGCQLASQDHELYFDDQGDEIDGIYNSAERIIIDLNFGAQERSENVALTGGEGNSGRVVQHLGAGHRSITGTRRRLSSLLRDLVESPDFRTYHDLIRLNGYPEMRVCDFFVPFRDINASYIEQFRGWWGFISDAQSGSSGGVVWINSAGRNLFSFRIPSVLIQAELFQRFHIQDLEQLAGAYILVLGKMCVAQSGKLYCDIQSLNQLAIRNIRRV